LSADNITSTSLITNSAQIGDGLITNAKIGTAAITSAKIADAQITNAKIGDAQITTAKIGDAQITNAKIGDAAITAAKIGTAQVDTLQIKGQAVTLPISAYTSGEIQTTHASIQALSYTPSGAPAIVTISFAAHQFISTMRALSTSVWTLTLYRQRNSDGAVTKTLVNSFRFGSYHGADVTVIGLGAQSLTVTDTPPAGVPHTYVAVVQSTGVAVRITQRSLVILEAKR
jgi:hypothetical protein